MNANALQPTSTTATTFRNVNQVSWNNNIISCAVDRVVKLKLRCYFNFFLLRREGCLYKDGSNAVTEVNDGAWFIPKECTNCTCTSGRLHCARIECDCTNNDHVQSICCAHCNAQASCVHQELTNVRFRSGQQWIYQCQTCECLVSK